MDKNLELQKKLEKLVECEKNLDIALKTLTQKDIAKEKDFQDFQSAILNILEDIDAEKKQLEQNQRALINMLEEINRIDAEKKKVDNAYQKTREVNKELEAFASAAAHDLKAPLRVIGNAATWIEDDLKMHFTEETRENMDLLQGRVKRMEKLLDDLLEYARIGRTQDDAFTEIISGAILMKNILELLSPPKDFTITVSPEFAHIQVCRMPLQQILLNLTSNAIKHHDKKEGHIDVTVTDNGSYYTFAVKDDGPGIATKYHDKIFDMFQTLKSKDQVEGSGMGLAIVRRNIEVFGGKLKLESDVGAGSKFSFTWPKR